MPYLLFPWVGPRPSPPADPRAQCQQPPPCLRCRRRSCRFRPRRVCPTFLSPGRTERRGCPEAEGRGGPAGGRGARPYDDRVRSVTSYGIAHLSTSSPLRRGASCHGGTEDGTRRVAQSHGTLPAYSISRGSACRDGAATKGALKGPSRPSLAPRSKQAPTIQGGRWRGKNPRVPS